mmetsp:Transcript_122003/g.249063  ORF Transcript_122003/g.249063 Transcript_122003/m.249063 type:complete len:232 (-) Transcript_122003:71-766(-)
MGEIIQLNSEDPFAGVRGELGLSGGEVPAFEATTPGMSVMTLEVPSTQSKECWRSFLNMLSIADGMVILRPSDTAEYDEEGYLYNSPFLGEVYEILDARPMFIVCVVNGPLRASMCFFAGIASLVLATKESTFGFPDFAQNRVSPLVTMALKKRMTDAYLKRMTLVGDSISAIEAQRVGLVDFLADAEGVENEVCRLIYRHCSPQTGLFMYKPDMVKAMQAKEAEQDYAGK